MEAHDFRVRAQFLLSFFPLTNEYQRRSSLLPRLASSMEGTTGDYRVLRTGYGFLKKTLMLPPKVSSWAHQNVPRRAVRWGILSLHISSTSSSALGLVGGSTDFQRAYPWYFRDRKWFSSLSWTWRVQDVNGIWPLTTDTWWSQLMNTQMLYTSPLENRYSILFYR